MAEHKKIVIVGSGITGLATAWYLEQFGIKDYVILERNLDYGGLCRSVRKNGFTFDYTGHVLWRMDPETKLFFETVMGENMVKVSRRAAVFTHGNFVPYPFQTHLKHLPPQVAYECLHGFLHRHRYLKGVDFESWSLASYGDGIHKHFMVPFNEKLFGVPLKEMTCDWVEDIPIPTLEQILKGTILGETFSQKGNSQFYYPKVGGMQSLVDELVKRVGKDKIMTGRNVKLVDVKKKEIHHLDFHGNRNVLTYDSLVSTASLKSLLKYIQPQDGGLREFAGSLRANAVACVMLGFEKPLSDLHWLYVPEKKFPFYRIGFANNLTDSVAPHGCGSITAEITLPNNANVSVNYLINSTLMGLKEIGLLPEQGNDVLAEHVEFISPAYVIYDLVRKNVPKIVQGLKNMDIHAAGRFGAFHYTSVSDNIAEARIVAKRLAGRNN